jgi:hypothetical protein
MLVSLQNVKKEVFFSSFNNDIKNRPDITVSNPMRSGYAKELIDLSITAPVGGSGHAKVALPKDRRLTGTQGLKGETVTAPGTKTTNNEQQSLVLRTN